MHNFCEYVFKCFYMKKLEPILITTIFILLVSNNLFSQLVYPLTRNDSALIVKYQQAYEDQQAINHKKEASRFLNLIAMLYWEKNHFDKAEKFFIQSLNINKKLANENGVAMINNNLAMIYADKKDYKKSFNYFEKTLAARRVGKEKIGIISALINQAVVLNKLKKYEQAIKNLLESLDIARELNDPNQMKACYGMLSETYEKSGNTKKSLYYYEYYKTFNDLVTRKKIKKSQSELKAERLLKENAELSERNKQLELNKTESELRDTKTEVKNYSKRQKELLETLSKKEMSIRIIKQESIIKDFENATLKVEKKQQLRIIIIISIGFLIIAVFAIFLYRLYIQKKRINQLLKSKNQEILQHQEEILTQRDELEASNKVIAEKNHSITQSINYAKHIQNAMLERKNLLSNYLPKSFINYYPRDIVSGDFYWHTKIGSKIFVIVSDCTGHGVPGAFISMIGNNILNDVIEHRKIFDPAEILKELDDGVVESLNQKHSNNTDGMDIAVCVIDEKTKQLNYAGAKAPIMIFQNNELNYVKADRKSIGGMHIMKRKLVEKVFTTKTFDLSNSETSVYMFSDGIIDQFDSLNQNKFSTKRLKNVLINVQNLNIEEQKEKLSSEFKNWKGFNEQLDDVTILGFKVKY